MTALRLALTELRRIGASRVGRLALVAMVLVPSIYGGLYLYANDDPYAWPTRRRPRSSSRIRGRPSPPASGSRWATRSPRRCSTSTRSTGLRVSRGRADSGLRDGDYDLVLVLPRTFSADLASSATNHPRQATLQIRTNDAKNAPRPGPSPTPSSARSPRRWPSR